MKEKANIKLNLVHLAMIAVVALGISLFTISAYAATYYVDGVSGDDKNPGSIDSPWKTIHNANITLQAGDTAYIRGGIYLVGPYNGPTDTRGIDPDNSGSAGNVITYSAYPGEQVVFQSNVAGLPNRSIGIRIYQRDYIKVTGVAAYGMKFTGFGCFVIITGDDTQSADYNEISYCEFSDTEASTYYMYVYIYHGAKYNHLHHNKFHEAGYMRSDTSNWGDMISVGRTADATIYDTYNVIENNESYATGHSTMSISGKYNVVRNNYFHHEEWYEGHWVNIVEGGNMSTAGLTEWTLGAGWSDGDGNASKSSDGMGTLTQSIPIPATLGHKYKIQYRVLGPIVGGVSVSYGGTTDATRTSINRYYFNITATTTDDLVFTPTSSDSRFSIDDVEILEYVDTGIKSGYRNIISNGIDPNAGYHLIEGNRIGHAGERCSNYNQGGGGMKLATPYNIVRYNSFFANKGLGLFIGYYPGYSSGAHNYIYNNTFYHNGYYSNPVSFSTAPFSIQCASADDNCWQNTLPGIVVKNNASYQNDSAVNEDAPFYDCLYSAGFGSCKNYPDKMLVYATFSNNWDDYDFPLVDPKFTDLYLGDTTSWTLPDLNLQSDSPLINQGTYFTQADGSASNSTQLIVDDAGYFQDGNFGQGTLDWPSNIDMQADWIAIGTVTNTVQISSIDYNNNIITLDSRKTWSDGDPVWLYKKSDGEIVLYNTNPDMGAHEYIEEQGEITGDVNLDNLVNIQDIQACVNHILGSQSYGNADVNGDSSVDVLDVQEIVNIILSG